MDAAFNNIETKVLKHALMISLRVKTISVELINLMLSSRVIGSKIAEEKIWDTNHSKNILKTSSPPLWFVKYKSLLKF